MDGKFEARGGQIQEFTLPNSCVVSRTSVFYNSASTDSGKFNDTQSGLPAHEYTLGIWYTVDTAGILRPVADEPGGGTLIGALIVKTTKDQSCQESGKAPIILGDFYGKTKVLCAQRFTVGQELTVAALGYISNSVNTGDLVVARVTEAASNSGGTAGASTAGLGFTTRQCGYVKA